MNPGTKLGPKCLGVLWWWQSSSWDSTTHSSWHDMLRVSVNSWLLWKDSWYLGNSFNISDFQMIPDITFRMLTVKTIFPYSTNLKQILNSSQETETSKMKTRTVTSISLFTAALMNHEGLMLILIGWILMASFLFMLVLVATQNQCQYKWEMNKRNLPINGQIINAHDY